MLQSNNEAQLRTIVAVFRVLRAVNATRVDDELDVTQAGIYSMFGS